MHSYTIDSDERDRIPIYIALFSIILTWIFSKYFLKPFTSIISIPIWWLDTPAVVGFYGIWYKVFDLYLWKIRLFKNLFRLQTPDLSGDWIVTLRSSYDNFNKEYSGEVNIQQTWTSISIKFENDTSSSFSKTASIYINDLCGTKMSYEYQNSPNADTVDTMNMHIGFTSLRIIDNNNALDGEYFSNSGRRNYGRMSMIREE